MKRTNRSTLKAQAAPLTPPEASISASNMVPCGRDDGAQAPSGRIPAELEEGRAISLSASSVSFSAPGIPAVVATTAAMNNTEVIDVVAEADEDVMDVSEVIHDDRSIHKKIRLIGSGEEEERDAFVNRTPTERTGSSFGARPPTNASVKSMSPSEVDLLRKVSLHELEAACITDLPSHFRICKVQLGDAGFARISTLALRMKMLASIRLCKDAYAEGRAMVEDLEWDEIESDLVANYADASRVNTKIMDELRQLSFNLGNGQSFVQKARIIYGKFKEMNLPGEGLLEKLLKKLSPLILEKLTERCWSMTQSGLRLEQLPPLTVLRELLVVIQQASTVARLGGEPVRPTHQPQVQRIKHNDRVFLAQDGDDEKRKRDDFVNRFKLCRFVASASDGPAKDLIPSSVDRMECVGRQGGRFLILGFNNDAVHEDTVTALTKIGVSNHPWSNSPKKSWPKNTFRGRPSGAPRQ